MKKMNIYIKGESEGDLKQSIIPKGGGLNIFDFLFKTITPLMYY